LANEVTGCALGGIGQRAGTRHAVALCGSLPDFAPSSYSTSVNHEFLLVLNQLRAVIEAAGEPITPPGLPLRVKEHGKFIMTDCIRI
jgi:hypothetical protein